MFVSNDSAENGCGAEATVVGTAGGGNGAVNIGDDPNGAPGVVGVGGLGRPRLDDGDEDALESGGHEGGPTKFGVFGYARLETGYVEPADDVIGCPGAGYGVSNEGAMGKAADGITEEPGVDAVDFADKLLTLKCQTLKLINHSREPKRHHSPIIISFSRRTVAARRAQHVKRIWSCRCRACLRCGRVTARVGRHGPDGLR